MANNPALLRACGTIGLFAAIAPIFADLVSWFFVESYSPIAHSISRLAVGPSSWLIDLGLWVFVVACLAVATGLWSWRIEARRPRSWTGAVASLLLLGVATGIVARVNEYAGTGNPGANIHFWTVCAIGMLFALASLLAISELRNRSVGLGWLSMVTGTLWIVLCPVYWFFTDEWSGAVERLLALIMIIWLVSVSRVMLASAQRLRQMAKRHGGGPERRTLAPCLPASPSDRRFDGLNTDLPACETPPNSTRLNAALAARVRMR